MMCGLIYHDVLPHRRYSGRLLAGRLAQVWALRVLERAPYGRLGCHAAGTAASRGMQQSLERYRHVCRCGGSVCSRGTGLYAQAYSSIQPLYLYSSIQMLYLCTCHYTEAHRGTLLRYASARVWAGSWRYTSRRRLNTAV
jgi:hypothetical protein